MFTLTVLAVAAETPDAEDVVAGPVALLIFLLLALAVAFLGWSLTKQLRKAPGGEGRRGVRRRAGRPRCRQRRTSRTRQSHAVFVTSLP
ncbi:hypothetical protein [Nocardioides sp. B-3]|uniref:hypothetical protein n=1 Tax=Nocardioides sp. B-3 TaxID=2895565 RepID=UPI0021524B13|nr:hypothetical protein [Nocardioides sp. B-3]UUZ60345.1 hypothetical protein LP418_05380 [Nocardioides sp. B-3]